MVDMERMRDAFDYHRVQTDISRVKLWEQLEKEQK